ncbi:MAG TPA: hypothetical protein DEH78_23150 [Solibacterales bacterium]|nr:hypothetical protein [Bryobacterales bacterium]
MHTVIACSLLACGAAFAQASAQSGPTASVSEVAGSRVKLRLPAACAPAVGDVLELLAKIPGFEEPVPVQGSWKVLRVADGVAEAEASAGSPAGAAQVGNTAAIRCAAPAPVDRPAQAGGGLTPPFPAGERNPGIAGANLVAPGPSAPSQVPASPPPPLPGPPAQAVPPPPVTPPALIVFPIRHAHPGFRSTLFAAAQLSFNPSSSLWMYTETGVDPRPDHVYGFFCKDVKDVKRAELNRGEMATLDGSGLRQPVKLTIRAGRTLEQLVGEEHEVAAIVGAFDSRCGKR